MPCRTRPCGRRGSGDAPTARALIRRLESVPRNIYSGLIGWTDRKDDGQWDIALRCAELTSSRLRLYAGPSVHRPGWVVMPLGATRRCPAGRGRRRPRVTG
ncbi:chorismate-binding protein [Streptomyces sp. NPDC050355]|uniref:chorismate-binding protein n=1 Tax=Streptomyces sp. NPDC050355 TaxID=3365609 RepID=UPI0037B83FA6